MICNLRSEVPIWFKWFMILAPKFRSKSKDSQTIVSDRTLDRESLNSQNDLRTRSKVPIWIKWFAIHARTSDLNQKIREPSFQIGTSERRAQIIQFTKWFVNLRNDLRVRSKVLIWIKWFTNPLDLNQMIRDTQIIHKPPPNSRSELNYSPTCTKVLIWIKKIANPPKFWSKSYDSRSTLLNPDLKNDSWTIISDQDSERGSQIIQFVESAPKSRSESNDLRTCSDLNKMIHYLRSEVPIWISDQNSGHGLRIIQLAKWCANLLRSPALNQMICDPAPKFRSKSSDSRSDSAHVLNVRFSSIFTLNSQVISMVWRIADAAKITQWYI